VERHPTLLPAPELGGRPDGKNSGNNLGDHYFPTVHFEEVDGGALTIELMLKGGGCENVGAQYSLPNSVLGAGRDLAGVRKVVLDAVHKAQGQGCAPGILGVAIGGDRGSSYLASKETLLRRSMKPIPTPSWRSGRTPDRRSQPTGDRPDGFWRKNYRFGRPKSLACIACPPAITFLFLICVGLIAAAA
jgi:hypothetical protein